MNYTVEIKDEQGLVVSELEISPTGGDKLHTLILDANLNKRQEFPLNSMKEVNDFYLFWKGQMDLNKVAHVLEGQKRFTDSDGISEVNGYIVNLEFKSSLAEVQSAKAQIVKAIREARFNQSFTFFVVTNGDIEETTHIVPISPWNLEAIETMKADSLKKIVVRGGQETLFKMIRHIESWTKEEANIRVKADDQTDFQIAGNFSNAVHLYNINEGKV